MMYGKFVVDRKDPVKGNTEQELNIIEINHQNHSLVFTFLDGKIQMTLHDCFSFPGILIEAEL